MSSYMPQLINEIIAWIKNFYSDFDPDKKAVIGISGGKDSSVAATLLCKALGKNRVVGVSMPNGTQSDMDYVNLVFKILDIQRVDINIADCVNSISEQISNNDISLSAQTKQNLPARLRMSVLYAVAQSVNGLVVNTCNLSEDWVGYCTKYGDSAGDFSLFSTLTVKEVICIGKYLGLPDKLTEKPPSDGLCGKTDEDNLGFTYEVLDKYIRTGKIEDSAVKELIDKKHKENLFKLKSMVGFDSGISTIPW